MEGYRKHINVFLIVGLLGLTFSERFLIKPMNVMDFLSLGLNFFSFTFDELQAEHSTTEVKLNQEKLDKFMSDITAKLDNTTNSILSSIHFELQFAELRRVSMSIEILLDDLQHLLKETRTDIRALLIRQYSNNFRSVSVQINTLDTILKGNGISLLSGKSLLRMLTDNLKCSIYDLNNFEYFYMQLATGGMTLELHYELLNNNSLLYNSTKDKWKTKMENMIKEFDNAIDKCNSSFAVRAKDDFTNNKNQTVLTQVIRRKYADKSVDVLNIKQPHKIYVRDKNDPYIFMDTTDGLRLAIFSERKIPPAKLSQDSVLIFKEETLKVCKGDINNALENIKVVVKTMLTWNRLTVSPRLCLLFVGDNNTFSTNALDLEEDTPSTRFSTNCMNIELLMYLEKANVGNDKELSEVDQAKKDSAARQFLSTFAILIMASLFIEFSFR